jgi:hypothetical protein
LDVGRAALQGRQAVDLEGQVLEGLEQLGQFVGGDGQAFPRRGPGQFGEAAGIGLQPVDGLQQLLPHQVVRQPAHLGAQDPIQALRHG